MPGHTVWSDEKPTSVVDLSPTGAQVGVMDQLLEGGRRYRGALGTIPEDAPTMEHAPRRGRSRSPKDGDQPSPLKSSKASSGPRSRRWDEFTSEEGTEADMEE